MQFLISHKYADEINFRFTGAATFCKVGRDITVAEVMESFHICPETLEAMSRPPTNYTTVGTGSLSVEASSYFVYFNPQHDSIDDGDILIKISTQAMSYTDADGMYYSKAIIQLSGR